MSKKEKKKSRVGAFLGGGFLGFFLGIGTVVGLVCLVYFNLTPNMINKTFKTDINVGETNNNKTLSDLVGSVANLVQNKDTYKLSDLKNDFGIKIKDNLFGIDISDLKEVNLTDLAKAIEDKFGNISADELRNVSGMNLEENVGSILNKTNTYYYSSTTNNLYKNSELSNVVNFKYAINAEKTKVVIRDQEFDIADGETEITLWYLPISTALGDFMKNMGDNLTLADLETSFGVDLPKFMDGIDKVNTTVNELESEINKLKVASFLGYTIDDSDPDNIVVKDGETAISGVLATLAKYALEDLEEGINSLTLQDIFSDDETTGVLALIDNPDKVTLTGETDVDNGILSIGDALSKVIEEKTIDDFITADLVEKPEGYTETTKLNWILTGENTYKQIKDLLLQDVVNIFFDNIDISKLPSSKPTT